MVRVQLISIDITDLIVMRAVSVIAEILVRF